MPQMIKAILVASLVLLGVGAAFNTGLLDTHDVDALYTILPLGAVLLGLYLVLKVMEKESAGSVPEDQAIQPKP
jgi:hypothetical protein